jgi:biopolymer transport protein ExbB
MKEIEGVMESTANVEVGEMEKGTGYLGIIAGIAPMLGFIGTISGIIRIFYTISLSDNISIGIIAGGLYEKMITSGAGLVVGVLAYTGYHILSQMIQNFTLRAQRDSLEFIRCIMSPAS